jgi:CxxC motif-containing protein (DUF1111 family)
MPLIRITQDCHDHLEKEIKARRQKGEVPRPTYESVVQELVLDRQKKTAGKK